MRFRRSHLGVAAIAVCLLAGSIAFRNPFTDKIEKPTDSSVSVVHSSEAVPTNHKPASKLREHALIADELPALNGCIAPEIAPAQRHPLDLYSCLLEARALSLDAAAAGEFFDEAAYLQDRGCLTLQELLERIKNNPTPEALEALKGLISVQRDFFNPVISSSELPAHSTDDEFGHSSFGRLSRCRKIRETESLLGIETSPDLVALELSLESDAIFDELASEVSRPLWRREYWLIMPTPAMIPPTADTGVFAQTIFDDPDLRYAVGSMDGSQLYSSAFGIRPSLFELDTFNSTLENMDKKSKNRGFIRLISLTSLADQLNDYSKLTPQQIGDACSGF